MTSLAVGVLVASALLVVWDVDPSDRLELLLARRSTRRSVRSTVRCLVGRSVRRRKRAASELLEPDPPLVLDLTAAALAAGSPPEAALQVVADAVGGDLGGSLGRVAARLRLGTPWQQAWSGVAEDLSPLRRTLGLALATGAPGSTLLRNAAGDERRRRHRAAQAAAARLGVRMVLPLGLCALPAFVVWAVVPVVLSLAGRVLGG